MRYYAGVGSRETPEDIQDLMSRAATYLASRGWVLRSGGAKGADSAFQSGVFYVFDEAFYEHLEIFEPYAKLPEWTKPVVELLHPAPEKLGDFAWRAHRRNALIVLGLYGNNPVEFALCWTKDGKASGGTGMAIRMAKYFDIPVYNLHNPNTVEWLENKIQ